MSGKEEAKANPDVEQTAKELMKRPGVKGYLVFNDTGIPVKWSATGLSTAAAPSTSSTPIPADVIHHAALVSDLCAKAQSTCSRLFDKEVGGPDAAQLKYIRMRTKENEIIVAPGDGVTLVVVQQPHGKPVAVAAKTEEEKHA